MPKTETALKKKILKLLAEKEVCGPVDYLKSYFESLEPLTVRHSTRPSRLPSLGEQEGG